MVLALLALSGCEGRPQAHRSGDLSAASPAALLGGQVHEPSGARDLSADHDDWDAFDEMDEWGARNEAPRRSQPPPRPQGKPFNTSLIDRDGRLRRVEIRMLDGVAETRVDGRLVAPERVRVHRRSVVEILDERGATELAFNLPRGMTSVVQTKAPR